MKGIGKYWREIFIFLILFLAVREIVFVAFFISSGLAGIMILSFFFWLFVFMYFEQFMNLVDIALKMKEQKDN